MRYYLNSKISKILVIIYLFLVTYLSLIKSIKSENILYEPPNLGILKNNIKYYINSGQYEKDIEKVINKAKEYIYNRTKDLTEEERSKLAVVFDIDETSLSNLEYEYKYDFGFNYETWIDWVKQAKAQPIKPTLELYKYIKSLNIKTFFITGRNQLNENLNEDPTIINLKKAGYYLWEKVYFKPTNTKISTIEYKTNCRKDIESKGYKIILNIGDQYSDLEGGYSEAIFKLPNPMYYIP
ncbi:MAG: HAD family acid phosphatase [bacterium]|nr:HAD family acid phosphatase [bacterium]